VLRRRGALEEHEVVAPEAVVEAGGKDEEDAEGRAQRHGAQEQEPLTHARVERREGSPARRRRITSVAPR
jgi:hypothetical protein